MSTQEMLKFFNMKVNIFRKDINTGEGVTVIHHLGDSLWKLTSIDGYQ